MKKIVLFGDSLLGRFGKDYIIKLEEAVTGLIVYNCATGGFNTRDGKKRADFIAKLKADYVCLSFGANDSNPSKNQPVPVSEFANNYISIIESFNGSKVVLFSCPPVYDPNDVSASKEFNNELAKYNFEIQKISVATGSLFIDSMSIYQNLLESGKNYHVEDGLHLNEFGYLVFIKELAKLLNKKY